MKIKIWIPSIPISAIDEIFQRLVFSIRITICNDTMCCFKIEPFEVA
jgi:hypothetical protein